MLKKSVLIIIAVFVSAFLSTASMAKSQCSGLSNSSCGSNSTCTWRKASTDKNGKKTKAHCRALPGKSKAKSASKKTTTKAKRDLTTKTGSTKQASSVKKTSSVKKVSKTAKSSSSKKTAKKSSSKSSKKTQKSKSTKKSTKKDSR